MFYMPFGKRVIEMKVIEMKAKLIEHFYATGAILKGDFVGKSGNKYNIETDVRNSLSSHKNALKTAGLVLEAIDREGVPILPFLGVPETGTFIAFYLNQVRGEKTGFDFYPNMMRSVEKDYQSESNTVYSVLPVSKDQEYVFVEDDVVTGNIGSWIYH